KQMPELHPFLRVIPHRSILNLFYQGEIELLFGFKDDIPIKDGTIYSELIEIPLCCILPCTHPNAQKSEICEDELLSEKITVCNSYAVPSRAAEVQNRISQHILPDSAYICENMQVLLALVRAGYGCSILPQMNFINSDITCVPLKDTPPLSYGIFYRSGALNPLLKQFIDITKSIILE
ncbi:MAG: LysR family transcriptional regulator, partial [Lachnospiraceae bacterium]|nr:LysR family transcriptional regulator [Lachnospiraceae bacterium]